MPRVAVVGGSLGGLTAALLLRDLGCTVNVYERSAAELEARGAGIAVLEATWRYPVERLGIPAKDFASRTRWVRFHSPDGSIVFEEDHPYYLSSWNAVYRVLLNGFGRENYHLASEVIDFHDTGDQVEVTLADGRTDTVDLLVFADGITSAARARLLPDVVREYAGYVAWRGVMNESDLQRATFDELHDTLAYQVMDHSHILVYPIPGPTGDKEPGKRLMNIVWYRNVAPDELGDLLTDVHGEQRQVSVPPGLMREDAIAEMREAARTHLAPQLAEVVTSVPEPFVQAVFDIEVPQMRFGRVCIIGDAAFAARPHAAAGTAKAAENGWILAEELGRANGDVLAALAAWEPRQLELGHNLLKRTREIGRRSQFEGTYTPGDPNFVFGLYGPGH